MAKGIDPKFVHYGIRKDDLATIEAIRTADKYNRAVIIYRQIKIKRQVGLKITYLYFLYEHGFKFIIDVLSVWRRELSLPHRCHSFLSHPPFWRDMLLVFLR
jgi:hypothetical protein